jgi:hypothetical protein
MGDVMNWPLRIAIGAAIGLGSSLGQSLATGADFADLLAKVPPSANVLVMLNADQIFQSDVATREHWKQHYDDTYSDSPLLLPPTAQQFVLASDLDLAYMKPRWEVAAMRLSDDPSMGLVARAVHGESDKLSGLETITTPKNALIVKFGPNLFGMMRPASRQAAARWIREASAAKSNTLSPYLATVANIPDQVGTEIMMAIDLTDALNHDRVRQALEKSTILREKSIDLDSAAEIVTSIRGMALGVRVTNRTYGKLKVDFDHDLGKLADVAQPLLLEILRQAGAEIDEFTNWKVATTPKQITIEGELTANGLRRLFSFLELDATAVAVAETAGPTQPSKPDDSEVAKESLKYYQSIARLLNDLSRERDAATYSSIALWFDKYAKRIDRLPTLNIDKDLINYGAYVVARLRDARDAIQGVGIRSGAQSAGVGGYAEFEIFTSQTNAAINDVSAAEAQRRAIRAGERAVGSTDARAVMREIQDESSKVRRQMTDRYKIEFSDTPSK